MQQDAATQPVTDDILQAALGGGIPLNPASPASEHTLQGTGDLDETGKPLETTTPNPELDSFDAEKQASEAEDDPKSILRKKRWPRFRYWIYTMYRRLFSIVFLGNMIAFIYYCAKPRKTAQKATICIDAAAFNIMVTGLARQPLVINGMFRIFSTARIEKLPLRVRCLSAKVFCFAGVHSGCGVSALIWFTAYIGFATYQFTHSTSSVPRVSQTIMGLSWILFVLLITIIIAAYPTLRLKQHDWFELTHRFAGWTIVILFWPLVVCLNLQTKSLSPNPTTLGTTIAHNTAFWTLIITTLSIIHPWLLLRRVPVRSEHLSPHAVRIHFTHTSIAFGQALSIAHHPLKDWHAFGIFPDSTQSAGQKRVPKGEPWSVVVSKAGDWTDHTIQHPPTRMWTKGLPTYGFIHATRLFRSLVVVCTGSGLGPALSFLVDPERPRMRVVWQTKSPEEYYQQSIVDLVRELDRDVVIIDSQREGRKDLWPVVLRLVKESKAEAVCVVSNPKVTRELVYKCEAGGVPAFGPIFDS